MFLQGEAEEALSGHQLLQVTRPERTTTIPVRVSPSDLPGSPGHLVEGSLEGTLPGRVQVALGSSLPPAPVGPQLTLGAGLPEGPGRVRQALFL